MRNACGVFDCWRRNYAILAPPATWTACSTLSQRSSPTAITRLFDEWKMSKPIRVDVRVILQITSYILLLFQLTTAYLFYNIKKLSKLRKYDKQNEKSQFQICKIISSNKLFQQFFGVNPSKIYFLSFVYDACTLWHIYYEISGRYKENCCNCNRFP